MSSSPGINSIRKKHGRLVRAVAIFFLFFTAGDIALPQYFCAEEVGGLSLNSAASAPSSAVGSKQIAATDQDGSRPDEPTDQSPHEEDCFCCCAHILPGLVLKNYGNSELRSPAIPAYSVSVPTPPLARTYHPPRFA